MILIEEKKAKRSGKKPTTFCTISFQYLGNNLEGNFTRGSKTEGFTLKKNKQEWMNCIFFASLDSLKRADFGVYFWNILSLVLFQLWFCFGQKQSKDQTDASLKSFQNLESNLIQRKVLKEDGAQIIDKVLCNPIDIKKN